MKSLGNVIGVALLVFVLLARLGLVPGGMSVEGPKQILIVHETADSTAAQAILFTALRTGTTAEYLASKGHSLTILDDDMQTPDGQPAPEVQKWAPFGALPEILIVAPPDNVAYRGPLPGTAGEVLELLKRNGG